MLKSGDRYGRRELRRHAREASNGIRGSGRALVQRRGGNIGIDIASQHGGALPIWEPFGSKGGDFTKKARFSKDITERMRRINALEDIIVSTDDWTVDRGGAMTTSVDDDLIYVITGVGSLATIKTYNRSGTLQDSESLGIGGGRVIHGFHNDDASDELFITMHDEGVDPDWTIQVRSNSDPFTKQHQSSGAKGTGSGSFDEPMGLFYDHGAQDCYICDHKNNLVQVLSSSLGFKRQLVLPLLFDPVDCSFYDDELFVISDDIGEPAVRVYNAAFTTLIRTWDTPGLNVSIHVDSTGVYIVHAAAPGINYKVSVYTTTGTFVRRFAVKGAMGPKVTNIYRARRYHVRPLAGDVYATMYEHIATPVITGNVDIWEQDNAQTVFYNYPTETLSDRVSLGTPDGGVSIPALKGIHDSALASNYIADLREAIEAILGCYINDVSGFNFNWDDLNGNNLYKVSMEVSEYDWERDLDPATPIDELVGTLTYDVDINEIEQTIAKLEASTPG